MTIFGFDIKQFLGHEVLENIIKSAGGMITEKTREKITKTLEAKFGGFGTVDELLSLSACQIAHKHLGGSLQNIERIAKGLKNLSREERNKVTSIIGHDEQTMGLSSILYGKVDKKTGANTKEEISVKMNLRGAALIATLAEMTDEEILNFLGGFGALDTTSKNIREMIGSLAQIWNELEEKLQIKEKLIKPLDEWAGKDGNLRKIMTDRRERREKTTIGKLFCFLKRKGVY